MLRFTQLVIILSTAAKFCENVAYIPCQWLEPRSISSLSSVIVRVRVVLKRTVIVNID